MAGPTDVGAADTAVVDVEAVLSGTVAPGSVVVVRGFLVATNSACHLVRDERSSPDASRSVLVEPELVESLQEAASGLVGGPAYFADVAEVRGVLSVPGADGSAASLSGVEAVALLRERATYRALALPEPAGRFEEAARARAVALPEVLADPAASTGRRTRGRGFLVTTAEAAYLAPDPDRAEDLRRSILVDDPQSLDDRLGDTTFATGDPPFLYLEHAELDGVVRESEVEPFPVVLTDVTSITLTRTAGGALLVTEIPGPSLP
jgi:hypothetical protein